MKYSVVFESISEHSKLVLWSILEYPGVLQDSYSIILHNSPRILEYSITLECSEIQKT